MLVRIKRHIDWTLQNNLKLRPIYELLLHSIHKLQLLSYDLSSSFVSAQHWAFANSLCLAKNLATYIASVIFSGSWQFYFNFFPSVSSQRIHLMLFFHTTLEFIIGCQIFLMCLIFQDNFVWLVATSHHYLRDRTRLHLLFLSHSLSSTACIIIALTCSKFFETSLVISCGTK